MRADNSSTLPTPAEFRTPVERLAVTAAWVFIADFASKQWALKNLGALSDSAPAVPGLHLAVINNTRLAGGLHAGGLELQVTAIATIVIALLVARICDQLTAIDRSAPVVLGLLIGAGVANLADALVPPHGVVDFIGVTSLQHVSISFNVADIALLVGLALCARTMWMIGEAMWARRARREAIAAAAAAAATPWTSVPVTPAFARPLAARDHFVLSGGHALLAMCGFLWLYTMVVAWLPGGGAAAPNSLLCGAAVFAAAFAASQAKIRVEARRRRSVALAQPGIGAGASLERVVYDGSLVGYDIASDDVGGRRDRERSVPVRRRPDVDGPRDTGASSRPLER